MTEAEAVRLDPSTPVPWPAPRTLPATSAARLTFGTAVPPDRIVLRAFERIDPATGEPEGEPIFATELTKLGQNRYRYTMAGGQTVVYALPADSLLGGYLAIFCTWYVPVDMRAQGADSSADATATWLFRTEPRAR